MKNFFLIFILFFSFSINAGTIGSVTGLEIPRFVSLKSDKSNLRNGPSKKYPIKLRYINKNLPLKIIEEHGLWRKVVDFENNEGWVKKSLIKADRYGIINAPYNEDVQIVNKPKGVVVGKIGNRNIVKIKTCLKKWCLIKIKKNKGWVTKSNLWGVFENEIFNVPFYQPIINQFWKLNL
tara:strand:- start:66 stop:602 length:537 start_codon:yes stop_codon:yes gene_type:complete